MSVYRNTRYLYICDRCGNLATITDEPIADDCGFECECGSAALWEFTDEKKALAHGDHIRSVVRTGLFRTAP